MWMAGHGGKAGRPPQKEPPCHFLEGDQCGGGQAEAVGCWGPARVAVATSVRVTLPSVISQLPVLVWPRPPAWTSPADTGAMNQRPAPFYCPWDGGGVVPVTTPGFHPRGSSAPRKVPLPGLDLGAHTDPPPPPGSGQQGHTGERQAEWEGNNSHAQ